ncbi:MAG: hypothetical protein JXN64_06245 [Spirochaetes bacterium]|nr:hypothetical protein [Spirochaetota bacterium]
MKKLVVILISGLIFSCTSVMPRANSGYVITKDNQKIEFKDVRLWDDKDSIFVAGHYIMKRDIKEIHLEFGEKDYIFNH